MTQTKMPPSIPRPLVRTNQWVIVLSVVASWLTGFGWLLLIPLVSCLGGILFDFNPVMKIGKLFLRKPPKSYIPEDKEQQKFNSLIATVCLALAFIGFILNWTVLYLIFSIMVAIAAGVAIGGFCIGCFILYQWKQYQYRRRTAKAK